jgi:hypothetical protein
MDETDATIKTRTIALYNLFISEILHSEPAAAWNHAECALNQRSGMDA